MNRLRMAAANTDSANARIANRSAPSSERVRKASTRHILRMVISPTRTNEVVMISCRFRQESDVHVLTLRGLGRRLGDCTSGHSLRGTEPKELAAACCQDAKRRALTDVPSVPPGAHAHSLACLPNTRCAVCHSLRDSEKSFGLPFGGLCWVHSHSGAGARRRCLMVARASPCKSEENTCTSPPITGSSGLISAVSPGLY